MIKKTYIGLHVKYLLFSSDFNETWILSTHLRKVLKYQISYKSVQWKPSCSTRTDMTKIKVAFRHFAKAPKKNRSSLYTDINNVCVCFFLSCLQVWHPTAVQFSPVTGPAWQNLPNLLWQLQATVYFKEADSVLRLTEKFDPLLRKNDGLATIKPRIQGCMGRPTWDISLPHPYNSFPDRAGKYVATLRTFQWTHKQLTGSDCLHSHGTTPDEKKYH